MNKTLSLSIALMVLLILCSCTEQSNNSVFSIKGCVVAAPTNVPLSGILIRIMNDSYTLASTTSSEDGAFSISVEKDQLDASYHLNLYESKLEISKDIELSGFGLAEYDFGNIVFYDNRNPYDLPTLNSGGRTIIVHPVLREKYNQSDAEKACAALNDYGLKEWSLPNIDELYDAISEYGEIIKLPNGGYWSSTISTYPNNNHLGIYWGYIEYSSGKVNRRSFRDDELWYVLPIHVMQP